MSAIVAGTVQFHNGCLLLGDAPVVWPTKTRWDAEAQVLTLPDGSTVRLGGAVSGGGGYYSSIRGVEAIFGSDVATAAERCLGPTHEVAVFNPGSDVSVESSSG